MDDITKEEQEKIISSFKNIIADRCELQDTILSISEESIDQISSDIVKLHYFSNKESAHNFLLLIYSFIQIRPLKIPLYGKLLFKLSRYFAPLTSQQELMALFSTNKLIILNLLEAKLITINTIIKYRETNPQYVYYFCNEIRKNDPVFFGELILEQDQLEDFVLSITPEEHGKKRRLGLNDGEYETLIREGKSVSVPPNLEVSTSLYENSEFLSKLTYAEYAAYFGSIDALKSFLEYDDIKADRLLNLVIAGGQAEALNFLLEQDFIKFKITHECIRTAINFHTTKDIEININIKDDTNITLTRFYTVSQSQMETEKTVAKLSRYSSLSKPICDNDNCTITVKIKGKQNKNEQEIKGMRKYVNIKDLYLSLTKMNWHYFIDNLLFASDQINDPCDDEEFTLLHFACFFGQKDVVKLLLSLFGDKNYFNHDYENDTNFNYIHSSGTRISTINVNVQDKHKRTPLHLAVLNQKVEIIKILFKCDDTDFRIQDDKGKTAVHYSAETKNKEIIQLFVNSSPNHQIDMSITDKKGNTAFHYFCKPRCFDPSILTYICESARVNPNHLNHKNMTEVMHSIMKKKRIHILKVLVNSNRVDLNFQTPKKNETALMMAAKSNNFEAVQILMKEIDRINPNLQDFKLRTALHIAIHHVSPKIFEMLVRHPKVNMNIIDDFEQTPVFSSLYKHNFNFFDLILTSYKERTDNDDQRYKENNINFQHRDHFSQNLLHYAIRSQCTIGLDLLLNMYSINEPDSKGTNPFHQACSIGYTGVISYLITLLGTTTDEEENNTIDLYNSSTDHNGVSVFEMDEKKILDDMKISKYKPGEKIRINQKDSNGLTPFHYASQCNSIDTVNRLLLVPGIKIDEKDN